MPLREDLREALVAARAGRAAPSASPVFPAETFPNARTFGRDLKAAGVEPRNDEGRVVDFHVLRVTFVSRLATAGVHPRIAQALARHSSIELTMRAYTDLALLDLRGAVERTRPAAPGALAETLAEPAHPDAGGCSPLPLLGAKSA